MKHVVATGWLYEYFVKMSGLQCWIALILVLKSNFCSLQRLRQKSWSPFYVVRYYLKWARTSWTYSSILKYWVAKPHYEGLFLKFETTLTLNINLWHPVVFQLLNAFYFLQFYTWFTKYWITYIIMIKSKF